MAYNREWDRDKDSNSSNWNDPGWYSQDSRGNVRQREDDYYGGQDKRRKFNNGGYDNSYHDSSYDPSGTSSGQAGGFSSKKRLQASEPSPHVIFLGLEPDFTESDLQAFLSGHGCTVETVTIIRERASGQSKGFGFAQFPSTEHAKAFVDPHFPFVQVPPPASHGATAKAAFYKALDSGAPHNGRRVKIDFSQSASPHERKAARGNSNDGTRDIGNSQGPVLLLRGLDPLSGPQAIHQSMRNSAGLGNDGAKGMRRIILIKDKTTLASFGFGFVEFIDNKSAATVLANTMSPTIHPNGFRVSDVPVAASFANPHSFQPVADVMLRDEACIQSSLALGGVEGSFVRYWDENSTVTVLEFKVETPTPSTTSTSKEKKDKKKHKEEPALRPIALTPSTLPVSDKPLSLSLNKGAKVALGAPKPVQSIGFSMEDHEEEDDSPRNEPNKPHAVAKVGPMASGKKIAGNISKWNQVQEKLATPANAATAPPPAPTPRPTKSQNVSQNVVSQSEVRRPTTFESSDAEFDFSDTKAITCLLCSRKFNSLEVLRRHNRESDLHKKNLQDSALQDTARAKLASIKGLDPDQPKYRDRASERRTLFNQPDIPLPDAGSRSHLESKRPPEGPPRPPSPPPAPLNPGEDGNNVGNKLLKMMGWTEGTGLGTNSEGRIDPIETAIYAQGAGLGASKGKELGKYASSSYVSMAQDTARERYKS